MGLPSENYLHMNYYDESAKKIELPNDTEYNFLYERNKKYMNNKALSFDKKIVSFEELHTRIDEYARALYQRGVRESDIIAVGVGNTPEAVYLVYALNKLGAIVCPINPLQNEFKMLQDLEIVKPKMYIGINDSYRNVKKASKNIDKELDIILFPAVESMSSKLVKILYSSKQIVTGSTLIKDNQNLMKLVASSKNKNYDIIKYPKYKKGNISEVIFTGGSSGIHKGIDLEGNGLNCVVRSMDYILPLEPGQSFMGNLPINLGFGKFSLHYALCKNLEVKLTLNAYPKDFTSELSRLKPDGVMGGPIHWETLVNDIIARINDKNIKSLDFSKVNSNESYKDFLLSLKEALNKADLKDIDYSYLKVAISGGEQLKTFSEIVCSYILNYYGYSDTLWNGLGMTEMWAPVSVKRGKINTDGTVGTMIPFNNQKVVDIKTGEEVDYEMEGVLHVTGPGMMIGCHNSKEETAKVIYEDEKGTKWLNTGDIVKILSNGEIKYVNRQKRCFVCGVENIYPEQIENLLSEISEIKEVIVTKIPDSNLQFTPKYHISLRDPSCDIEKLKQKINKLILSTLGESFAPRYFEFYGEPLVRTPNGKLAFNQYQEKDNELVKSKSKILVREMHK